MFATACMMLLAMLGSTSMASRAAASETRIALVIGINDYRHLPPLANPVEDARLIAARLHDVGFAVDLRVDVLKDDLKRAVRDFAHRAEAGGSDVVALVYFAGHGIQDEQQRNFLAAADADITSTVDLPTEALLVGDVLSTLEQARPKIAFFIIDACRNSPYPATARGLRPGLGVEVERRGLLIAFSTDPGKVAQDGPPGGHSPFAAALADELVVPGLEAAQMFHHVSRKVLDATNQRQFPWVTSRLTDEFFFAAPDAGPRLLPVVPAAPPKPPRDSSFDEGEIAYGQVVAQNTTQAYEDWLRRYSDHPRKPSVLGLLQRLREEELWQRSLAAGSPDRQVTALQTLLLAFPNGVYASKASQKIAELQLMKPPAPSVPPEPPIVVSHFPNYDAPGNDRGRWRRDIADADACEKLCIADPGCAGYTYNIGHAVCIPKSRIDVIEPAAEATVAGVVTSRSEAVAPPPSSQPMVRRYEGKDAPGNDRGRWIRGISVSTCETLCLADQGCAGYTYNRRNETCIKKNRIDRLSRASDPAMTGVIEGRP